jgi:hypothetical protein
MIINGNTSNPYGWAKNYAHGVISPRVVAVRLRNGRLHGLGQYDTTQLDSAQQAAVQYANIDPSTVVMLATMGATDQDFINLASGIISVSDLQAQLEGQGAPANPGVASGDPTSSDAAATSAWPNLGAQISALDSTVSQLEAQAQSNTAVELAAGGSISAARDALDSADNYYQQYTDSLFGGNPNGVGEAALSPFQAGLVIVGAAAAFVLVYRYITIGQTNAQTAQMAVQAQLAQSQANQTATTTNQGMAAQVTQLQNQAAAASAAGNPSLAAQYFAQAQAILTAMKANQQQNPGATPGTITGWLSQNGLQLGVLAVVAILGAKVIKKVL